MLAQGFERTPLLSRRAAALTASILLTVLVAYTDFLSGYEMRLGVFYLLPILLATWHLGLPAGVVFGLTSMVMRLVMLQSSHVYSHDVFRYWESLVQLCMFAAFMLLLDRLRRALKSADERFVTVLESLDAAVYVAGRADGRLYYANRQFGRDFGGRAASGAEIERLLAGASPGFLAGAEHASRSGTMEKAEVRDLQSGRWYLVHGRTIRWVDGRKVGMRVLTDITEAKLAEELSRKQQEKLELTARLIAVGEMASTLAHELNQPLTAIANYHNASLRLLRAGKADMAEIAGYMEKTSEQAVRAGAIVHRLREFVRRRAPNRAPSDLNEILRGVMRLMEIEAERASVKVSLELAHDLPQASVDRVLIEQVTLNLVKNAIEAMQESPERRLTLKSSHRDETFEVEVEDTGSGVPQEIVGDLFQPFFTTKPAGMGLGLSICRSIVENHGGRLWHRSRSGGGASFHFCLPAGAQS